MSAVGKVMELDAAGLDVLDDGVKYPGLVTVTLTCTLSQSREWAALFGETVRAEQMIAAAPGPCGCMETYPQLATGEINHGPGCEHSQGQLPGVER